ncbi:Sjogren's syndrome/scleroderma autoantigen 1 family protein [Natrinema sp. LN54]|uniref:Sjogren's syndrome/scleroderma autoantigen 1 family protein n=1 Tax=Natrinema sp. LN54 TaxID=3458705 RepID=UPI004036A5DB
MSDFDKEAEREKLREKYEQDKEEREATQRMSDLLLKGATMTNAHCGTCGDPLFQENGTTFCPSCHGNPDAVQGTDLEAQPAEGGQAGAADDGADATATAPDQADPNPPADSTADIESGSGSGNTGRADSAVDVEPTTDPASATGQRTDERAQSTRTDADASNAATDDRQPRSTARPNAANAADTDSARSSRRAPASSPPSVDGDLEAARDALVRSLEKFAEEAAATDDPHYATECLEAAREAGEALSTLR